MQTTTVLVAICLLVAYARAAPQFAAAPNPYNQPAIARTEQRDDAGQFTFSYSTAEGTNVNERGTLKSLPDGSDYVLVKEGVYNYVSPDGTPVQVSYTADEFGFHPQSQNIPVPPTNVQPSFL